jgi:Family of unknown function (DUF6338)
LHLARRPQWFIMRPAGQAQHRWSRLTSNVRPHYNHAMDIWSADKLVLFALFVIPGFLMLKTHAVLGLESQGDSSKQVVDAVAYSCINYALLCWPILRVEASGLRHSQPEAYYGFYGFVVLVAPVLWAVAWRVLRSTQVLQRVLPHPVSKPWDYVFAQRRRYWMLVTFNDGKQVAGRFDSKSFASASPSPEQLYIEQAWEVNADGGLERKRETSAGLLILGTEVRTVELFHILEEKPNGNKTDH